MTDSPRRDGPDPTQPLGTNYPGYVDPAYASQAPYGPTYQAPPASQPTERLPAYAPYGYDPYASGQWGPSGQWGGPPYPPGEPPEQPPEGPKSPRWLWILAAVAVLAVICLVIALVIVNSSQQDTVVAPLPSLPEPSFSTPTPTSTSPAPTVTIPMPPLTPRPSTSGPATPGATETVIYNVEGDGRAINITYVDSGGVLQTEFNVMLPWSKQVELSKPAGDSASVSIINVGREVSCSITVDGVQVQQRTGAGLTICTGTG
jgi:hypothetical protein